MRGVSDAEYIKVMSEATNMIQITMNIYSSK